MRKVLIVLAGVMIAGLVMQFFLAAAGAFDPAPRSDSFEPHRLLGRSLFVLALVLIAVAALARAPGRLIGLTAAVAGLVVVQSLIAMISGAVEDSAGEGSTAANLIFGLHAVNGMFLISVTHTVLSRARQLGATRRTGSPAATPTPTEA
ncbi:MAG TPA: DUF6220 domain-containing protein [Natronosporangium sp.]